MAKNVLDSLSMSYRDLIFAKHLEDVEHSTIVICSSCLPVAGHFVYWPYFFLRKRRRQIFFAPRHDLHRHTYSSSYLSLVEDYSLCSSSVEHVALLR
jgi:hypothetical protein